MRFLAEVERVVDEFLTLQLAEVDSSVRPVMETLSRFVRRPGKRIRARFVHAGWCVSSSADPDDDQVVHAGAAAEMFQAFAIVHDDVMDRSGTRRGGPALHVALAAVDGVRGSMTADQKGQNLAILCGDLCFNWADELLSGGDWAPGRLESALRSLYTARTNLMKGQALDLLMERRFPTPAQARDIAVLKTATYTVQAPLQVGAILAGAPPEVLRALDTYGIALGTAYQLRDDLIGAFGDDGIAGKSCSDDLLQGKPTMLVATAWARADDSERRLLKRLYGQSGLDAQGVERVRALLRATGAKALVEEEIRRCHDLALEAIEVPDLSSSGRVQLTLLAQAAVERSA